MCERVCLPLTETAGDSLAACLVRSGAVDPMTGVPLVTPSTSRPLGLPDMLSLPCPVYVLPVEDVFGGGGVGWAVLAPAEGGGGGVRKDHHQRL